MGFVPGISVGPTSAASPACASGSACAANGTGPTNAPGSTSSAGVASSAGNAVFRGTCLGCAGRSATTAGDATGINPRHAADGFTIAAAISPGWGCVGRTLGDTSNTGPAADTPSQQRIDVTLGHTVNTGRVRPDRTAATAATGSRYTTSTCPAADTPGFVFSPLGCTVFPGFTANHAITGCIAHATTVGPGWWHASRTVDGTRSSYPAATSPTTGPSLGWRGAATVR